MAQNFHKVAISKEAFKVEYKYIRNDVFKWPVITKCIITDINGDVGIGIAICNELDGTPKKSIGRSIAYGRALKSLLNRESYKLKSRGKIFVSCINSPSSMSEERLSFIFPLKGEFIPKDNKIESISNVPDLDEL